MGVAQIKEFNRTQKVLLQHKIQCSIAGYHSKTRCTRRLRCAIGCIKSSSTYKFLIVFGWQLVGVSRLSLIVNRRDISRDMGTVGIQSWVSFHPHLAISTLLCRLFSKSLLLILIWLSHPKG
jgi:hypothetical protein